MSTEKDLILRNLSGGLYRNGLIIKRISLIKDEYENQGTENKSSNVTISLKKVHGTENIEFISPSFLFTLSQMTEIYLRSTKEISYLMKDLEKLIL